MMTKHEFRKFVEDAGPRNYSTKIKRNSKVLAWVMDQSKSLPEEATIPDRTTFILEGEYLINLYQWANSNNVVYSQALKMVDDGRLRSVKVKKHIKVPFDAKVGVEQVRCMVCGAMLSQITANHLEKHAMSFDQYRAQYPDSRTISGEAAAKISTAMSGRTLSEETKERISESRTGIVPRNHPRFVVGSYSPSEETRLKMSLAHQGKFHSEETRQKISEGNIGRVISEESIERTRQGLLKYYTTHPGMFKGKTHSIESKAKMAERAVERERNYTPERKAELAELRALKTRGLKRTPEQKLTYSRARSKWMSENPLKMRLTAGERTIRAWLEHNGIQYVMQWLLPGENLANGFHPHDFFLPDYNTIIEFDGAHHWAHYWFNIKGKSDEQIAEMLEAQVVRDAEQNWAAGQAGFRIIRVRGYADCGDSEWGTLEEQLAAQGFLIV